MSRRYKFHNPDGLYFVTMTINGWTDVFTRNEYKDIIVENLVYCQNNKGLIIFAWCIMTSHLHLIVKSEGVMTLSEILRDFKKFTSKAIVGAIKENYSESRREALLNLFITESGIKFWQKENHPVELWSNSVISQKLLYIHQNPVEEGNVFRAEDYVYSSAVDYAGENGLLEVVIIEDIPSGAKF